MKTILLTVLFILINFSYSFSALQCDGTDDYADCGNNAVFQNGINTAFSVTAWIKPRNFTKASTNISKYDSKDSGVMVWRFGVDTSRAHFYMPKEQVTGWDIYGLSTITKTNVWYHIAFTYIPDADKTKSFGTVYTNGIPGTKTARNYDTATANTTYSLKFGVGTYDLGVTWVYSDVVLYDVRYFNKTLSQNEIIDVMYNNVGITPNTVAMWKLDNTKENKYYDIPNKIGTANFIGANIISDMPPVVTNIIGVQESKYQDVNTPMKILLSIFKFLAGTDFREYFYV